MKERFLENYFPAVRIALMLVLSVCGIMATLGVDDAYENDAGVSVETFLLVSVFIGLMSVKELAGKKLRLLLTAGAAAVLVAICVICGEGFLVLIPCVIYEVMAQFPSIPLPVYFLPLLLAFVDCPIGIITRIVGLSLLSVIYVQHIFIIRKYKKQMIEDTVLEQGLKRNIRETEFAAKEELKRNMLRSENRILEERASLSQKLHDKLGHSINGSIYQLEGVKVLMEKDPEKSKVMLQAVIDQMRTGMDEIRAILRNERPEKKNLALLELNKICESCKEKGVLAELTVEGDATQISNAAWEVILDNAVEAITNSLKYAKCRHIDIKIVVMNKMVRCTIGDDGTGCPGFEDGMGISGMRRRVRAANGTIDFETEVGFKVTMLLPL
ncbi:MAG: hypothetical protein K6F93_01760 [Lachnospiraceae bacterium]|nr:hypothetical protein [Lachnospiraceae bacterium]